MCRRQDVRGEVEVGRHELLEVRAVVLEGLEHLGVGMDILKFFEFESRQLKHGSKDACQRA